MTARNDAWEDRTMDRDVWEIDHGWDVFSSDGEKVGDVQEVYPNYLVVSKGFFFPTDRYIPVSAITNVEHDRVYLNVTKSEIDGLDWETAPAGEGVAWTGTAGTTDTGRYAGSTGVTDVDRRDFREGEDNIRIPVVEEQLDVEKRPVQRGRVMVRKGVVTEQQSVNVPLREEEVHVERRRVDREYTGGDVPTDAFEETEISIPVRGEEVDVEKRAVVREEVDVTKEVRERDKRVSETVRREQVHVEGADDLTGSDLRDTTLPPTDLDADRNVRPS